MRYEFGGLIFGGAYTWRGLFSEFYGICFSKFYEMKLEVFVEFCPWPHLAVKGLSMPSGDKVLRVSKVNNNISRTLREKGCEK